MIKIKCEACGKEIKNPRMNQVTCGGKCSKEYQKAYYQRKKKEEK